MQKRTKQLITGVALLGAGAYGTLTGDDAIPWVSGFIHAGAENTASLLNNFSPGRFGPGGLKNIMYATSSALGLGYITKSFIERRRE